jgi:3-dehydroquinate dehydratase II
MKSVLIINGPNLNLLGTRETAIYGQQTFEVYLEELKARFIGLSIDYKQSNDEAVLISFLHQANQDAIIINGGAYSHTSIALADAVKAINKTVIAVHISNTFIREDFRKTDYLAQAASGAIIGLGLAGYALAIEHLLDI